ncbi:hypothetical protein G9P44_003776 [Scheffersomyces stipitis]|nr:hypothetical protein G9P44_003776 [Scheffersomyces stipitis]
MGKIDSRKPRHWAESYSNENTSTDIVSEERRGNFEVNSENSITSGLKRPVNEEEQSRENSSRNKREKLDSDHGVSSSSESDNIESEENDEQEKAKQESDQDTIETSLEATGEDSDPEEAQDDDFAIDPDDELLMHTYHTLPDNCKKFWGRRYDLFGRFDEGIYMTSELWYSVTPESIAVFVARLFKYLIPDAKSAMDVCCGGGGNTIHFAKYFDSVVAVDINAINVKCTEHNAQIYGVGSKIDTVVGDWNELSRVDVDGLPNQNWIPQHLRNKEFPQKTFDFIFSSPPWGGTSYDKKDNEFDLYTMEPFPIDKMVKQFLQYTENIGLFLPKSSNLNQIAQVTREVYGVEGKCRVIYIYRKSFLTGIVALMGPGVTGALDYEELFGAEEEYREDEV